MPITTRFEGPVLRVTPTGDSGWPHLHQVLEHSLAGAVLDHGHAILLIDSARASASASSDELRDAAAGLCAVTRSFAARLVVAPDELRYGLARMLAAYAEHLGTEILVFRSLDAAEAWLRARATAAAGG